MLHTTLSLSHTHTHTHTHTQSAHTPQQQQLSTISTPVVAGTSTKLETSLFGNKSNNSQVVNYACMWDQCGERFETLTDLTTHLMLNVETTHLVRDSKYHMIIT